MRKNYIFTSESVSEGHPDKVSDRISEFLMQLSIILFPKTHLLESLVKH